MRQVMEQVQKVGIDRVHVAGAEVTQEMIDRRQRVRQVVAAVEVIDRQAFARMRVDETEGAGGWQGPQGTRDRQHRDGARDAGDESAARD